MRINIYIENTYSDTEPKVYTEKGKLEVIQQIAQKIREDANWLFSAEDLYDKMKTNTGRIEVENIIRDYAEEEAERTENCDGWFEVEVTE